MGSWKALPWTDGQVRPLVKGEMLFCLCKEKPFLCLVIMILGSLGSQQSAKTHVWEGKYETGARAEYGESDLGTGVSGRRWFMGEAQAWIL